jgi:hypothetical protein
MSIHFKLILALLIMCLTSCGSPVFMSDARRFQTEPEIVQELQPYLADWATNPWDSTESERRAIAQRLNISIGILNWTQPNLNHPITVITIGIEALGDWSRGYLYVYEGVEITPQFPGWELRKVDDHLYIFNYVE